ncbi:MAG TPA: hypothetical protein VHX11_13070 [Acidobacteriaceae bacterium]|jgi:hypothetical protein|nr:hypothetical protein [Acidobacteriaceae bacterium]
MDAKRISLGFDLRLNPQLQKENPLQRAQHLVPTLQNPISADPAVWLTPEECEPLWQGTFPSFSNPLHLAKNLEMLAEACVQRAISISGLCVVETGIGVGTTVGAGIMIAAAGPEIAAAAEASRAASKVCRPCPRSDREKSWANPDGGIVHFAQQAGGKEKALWDQRHWWGSVNRRAACIWLTINGAMIVSAFISFAQHTHEYDVSSTIGIVIPVLIAIYLDFMELKCWPPALDRPRKCIRKRF